MSSTDSKTPQLLVFAGPNGSGKSTVTKGLPIVGLYVNADEIKRQSGFTDLEAAQEAELIRNTLLDARMDFPLDEINKAFETFFTEDYLKVLVNCNADLADR